MAATLGFPCRKAKDRYASSTRIRQFAAVSSHSSLKSRDHCVEAVKPNSPRSMHPRARRCVLREVANGEILAVASRASGGQPLSWGRGYRTRH